MRYVVFKFLPALVLGACATVTAVGQSSDQNFPTPVTTNEIAGTVKARDVGDPRLTTYFYAFNGSQGDIFINVVTKNFSGDIDVFNADGIQPLTKMVIYADAGVTETGRLIYLRKPEKLLLRIEGRSPNDDPATFRIRFGGSFIALADQRVEAPPKVGSSRDPGASGVRVNSVGTIVEVIPKPQKTKKTIADTSAETSAPVKEKKTETETVAETPADAAPAKSEETKVEETKADTVFENAAAKVTIEPAPKAPAKRPARTTSRSARTTKAPPKKTAVPPAEPKPDPLASIRLVVQLKDGTVVERSMSEVLRFNVVNGVLTVTGKDGKVTKYSILDVAKVTIE